MSLPFSFSNNTSPTGGQLDSNQAALGAMGNVLCTATGTNSIALTSGSNQPNVSTYTNAQLFRFLAAASSSGAVTVAIDGLSALPLYLPSGVQANTGDIVNGSFYIIVYLSALNSGGGGFLITSALPSSVVAPTTLSSAQRLSITNNTLTPNTKIDIAALQATLVTSGGTPIFLSGASAPSVTIDLTTTGANGMDTGARPTSGWVYLYLISNGAATAGLASATSPTAGAPTYPVGYSYSMFVGAMYCDSSQNIMRTLQKGRTAGYKVTSATNTAALVALATGAAGAPLTPTWASASVTGAVPLTAGEIDVLVVSSDNNVMVAPNAGYGSISSITNPPPFALAGAVSGGFKIGGRMVLEATTVQWASGSANGALFCRGWVDYYVNA